MVCTPGFREVRSCFTLACWMRSFTAPATSFDRHVGIYAVLIEQVDDIGLEALERCLGDFLDVFSGRLSLGGPTRVSGQVPPLGSGFATELGGDHHLVTKWSPAPFAHEFFVCEGTIAFGGVEKCDATFDSRPDQPRSFPSCRLADRSQRLIPIQPRPESRDFQVAVSQVCAFPLFSSP